MRFYELALKRESCRLYQDKPVEREKLDACLKAALLAPSACNGQPWRFVAVDDRTLSAELAFYTQDKVLPINRFTSACPAFIVVVEHRAGVLADVGGRVKDQQFAQTDIGLATAHLCLEAAEQGLGTCILGWFDEKKIKARLAIPKEHRVRLVVAVGYPVKQEARPKQRRAFEESVCHNGWKLK